MSVSQNRKANLDYQGNPRRTAGMDQANTRRAMGIDLQRSEFEDFMNAYRPTLEISRRELKSGASTSSFEDPKVDLGRSIKKLIKRTQTSPSIHPKNRREGIQRTSETHDRERSVTNELKPPAVPSQEKKARRPWSMHFDGSGYSTPSSQGGRSLAEPSPVRVVPEHNPGQHSTKNGKSKTERASAARELEQQHQHQQQQHQHQHQQQQHQQQQHQQHHQPHHQQQSKQKTTEAATPTKNGSKSKPEKPLAVREDPQIQVKVAGETAAIPAIIAHGPAPSPLNAKKKAPVKEESKKSSAAESKIISTPEHQSVHCLVITGNRIDRYLPPKHNPDPLLSLKVIQVPERMYHVILEFQESPTYEKPKTSASGLLMVADNDDVICSRDQRAAFAWLRESHLAVNGMLLTNVEKMSEFPYVTYLVVSGSRKELCSKMAHLKQRQFPTQRQQLHFLAGYEEAVTVESPPVSQIPEQPTSDTAGFVISLYQVNPGEDGGRFEQNWVTWTGARQLYSHVPEWMGLKRISIHKSVVPSKIINYVLICEFSSIMDYLTDACVLIDQLRARCCGFTGIYRILDAL